MKKSLSKRLFLITLCLLLGLMGLTLVFQTFIFEDFYIKKKTDLLVTELNKFRFMNSYKNSKNDLNAIYDNLENFQTKNSAKIG
ncbi:MAG: two-component sensor histidine kinase, partial [Clostridium sp.]